MDICKIALFCVVGFAATLAYGNALPAPFISEGQPAVTLPVPRPPAETQCDVSIGNSGRYELGRISNGEIKLYEERKLHPQKVIWTIICTQETVLGLRVQDNRRGTTTGPESWQFGLGNVNGSGRIGYYEVWLLNPKVDGRDVALLQEGRTTSNTSAPVGDFLLSWVAQHGTTPVKGRIFTIEVEIRPVLASLATMKGPVTDMTDIDGALTLRFTFDL